MKIKNNLLALDVGFNKTGWCIFCEKYPVAFGIIKPPRTTKKNIRVADDRAYRASYLAYSLKDIIIAHTIKGCVAELPSGGARNAKAMADMSAGTAVVAATLSLLSIPVEWTTPDEGKLSLCGNKAASKDEMMAKVRQLYPEILWPKEKVRFEDIADAVGAFLASKDGLLVRMFSP